MLTVDELEKDLHDSGGNTFYSLKVYIVRNNYKEEMKTQYNGFAVEGNAMDDFFVTQVVFRAANIILKGTEFEKVSWENYPEIKSSNGDIAFIKRIDSSNYAYLYAAYSYHT